MGSSSGEDFSQWDVERPNAHEEKIFVSVRIRPLNEKERARNDIAEWECINNTTIISKNNLHERSLYPAAYTFASIFAYGQTSSGKTYTMSGITEYAVADIYNYTSRRMDREFVLKFSAMEIYNESVRDLLSSDSTPLRLLDDPERGTVVEKLTEVTLTDENQLMELLSFCEAERQIGETSLNETSSRSHQILRLTVESSAREFLGAETSSILSATVNFIDLAGSERASQTSSAGARLKEGCHINRSLLTLGTVIRKLSKGRGGHIPYRDSKLTRILQNYLGGNARTAIICTMSPAHSHVEQSRNTLLFAMCAKDVNTNAQVNVVMSEKALVKQLQRELSRLENELKNAGSKISATAESSSLLKEKEILIQKMDKEIRDLTLQRDLAQSRLENLMPSAGDSQVSTPRVEHVHIPEPHEYLTPDSSEVVDSPPLDAFKTAHSSDKSCGLNSNNRDRQLAENSDEHFLSDGISPRLFMNEYFGPDPLQGWEKIAQKTDEEDSEDNCKEVRCIEVQQGKDRSTKTDAISSPSPRKGRKGMGHIHKEPYETLKQKIQDIQTTIDGLASPCSSDTDVSESKSCNISRSRSCREILTSTFPSPSSQKLEESDSSPLNEVEKDFPPRPSGGYQAKVSEMSPGSSNGSLRRKGSGASVRSFSMDDKELNMAQEAERKSNAVEAERKSNVVKAERKSDVKDDDDDAGGIVKEDEEGEEKEESNWALEFEKQRREIVELWDACNVPLVHRTYFFLLFKGDPSDSVYLEVELRRLSFLKQSIILTLLSGRNNSLRVLNRERDMLAKQLLKTFTTRERDSLYEKWGIKLDSKQRRVQLSRKLWTDSKDMNHVKDSAALVAKLVGIVDQGDAPKEMFGLSFFTPRPAKSYSWKPSMSSLM
ncbi:hypothetical protein LguiB_017161 [Lonicera macranthoides]